MSSLVNGLIDFNVPRHKIARGHSSWN